MSIWWLLWGVLSFILLGTTIWSLIILFQQKKTWSVFAKRRGLVYNKGTLAGPCEISGTIDGLSIGMFTATQMKEDSRKNRQVTVLQLTQGTPLFDSMAIGTPEMLPFLNSLDALTVYPLEHDKWDKKHNHLFSKNKKAADVFLSEERLTILNKILKIPNSDNLILLDLNQGVFRFETNNPLHDLAKLDSLVTKLIAAIKKLTPSEAEYKELSALYTEEIKEK